MVIEIFEVDKPNQKYPLFLSTRDIVSMDANTGEVNCQRGDWGVTRRLSTESFSEVLEHWRMNQIA